MKDSATVRIFLAKGSPTSVRTAEISNWTGKAVAGPRSQIEDMLNRVEAAKPGVYFLAGVKATGRQTDNGFVVLKGSEAVLRERPSTQKYQYAANLRSGLRIEGVLEEKKDRLVFLTNYEFSSPSAAAAVVHGGQANGLTAWKDLKGVSLKEKEEKDIQQTPAGEVPTIAVEK